MATINNQNVKSYIDKLLIDPYNIKIDLNTAKTTNDNVHRWVTLADAIKRGYKFNFDYDVKETKTKALPETTVTPKKRFYATGAGEARPFNNSKQAIDYTLAHPKDDPSENGLNYLMAGTFMNPSLTATFGSGIAGDRLFHDAVLSYNGVDIDKNGMWVYNPGGWVAGYGALKGLEHSIPFVKNTYNNYRLVNSMNKSARNYIFEQPELIPKNRYRLGDVEINDPNLNYRLGGERTVADFILSGRVRVHYEGEDVVKRLRIPGKLLLTKSFDAPMFLKGGLWYDGKTLLTKPGSVPNKPDLLVTREPLRFATKGGGPAKRDMGGRRIPFSEDLLNPSNTSAYIWEDGYGFRKFLQQPTLQFSIPTK